jgi:hypothetical protein
VFYQLRLSVARNRGLSAFPLLSLYLLWDTFLLFVNFAPKYEYAILLGLYSKAVYNRYAKGKGF